MQSYDASHEAANNVVLDQQSIISIPRRFTGMMRDIWQLQFRLPERAGKKAAALAEHRRFRAAYDFLILREDSGEELDGLGQWWTDYQDATNDVQKSMANRLQPVGHSGDGRGRTRGGHSQGGHSGGREAANGNLAGNNGGRRRRRSRKRKPKQGSGTKSNVDPNSTTANGNVRGNEHGFPGDF